MILFFIVLALQSPLTAVPETFRGDWAESAADCGYSALRVRIDAQGVGRGSGVRHATRVEAVTQDVDGLRWSFTTNDPESGPWVTRYDLSRPQGGRTTLVRDSKDGRRTFELFRCATPGAPG